MSGTSPEAAADAVQIELLLDDIKYLFMTPEFGPGSRSSVPVAGIEHVVNTLKPRSRVPRPQITILLPAGKLTPEIERETRQQIITYCDFMIQQQANDLAALRWEGLTALRNGFLFLAVCLFVAGVIESLGVLPGLVGRFVIEGLLIAGWVSLWYPIEILLYGSRPVAHSRLIYESIARAAITIKALEGAAGHPPCGPANRPL